MGFPVYHVSDNIDNIIEEFIPRIPREDTRVDKSEDNVTPRVCVSANIPGCITAKPKTRDEKILGGIYRVYEFDVDFDDKNLICYRELYEKGLVNDALLSKEYWITTPVKPIKTYLIKINRITMELTPVCPVEFIQDYLDVLRDDTDNSDEWLNQHGGYLLPGFQDIVYENLAEKQEFEQFNMTNIFWDYRRELGRLNK